MQNGIENFEITSINFVRKDFEFELQSLCMHMTAKVHAILAPFLAFASTYSANKAYNMLAWMLDPHFKSLNATKTFVGCVKSDTNSGTIWQFDANIGCCISISKSWPWWPYQINTSWWQWLVPFFGGVTSIEATLQSSLKIELLLFYHLHMWSLKTLYCPWHGGNPMKPNFQTVLLWPNLKILKILQSQNKIERSFSIVGMLTIWISS